MEYISTLLDNWDSVASGLGAAAGFEALNNSCESTEFLLKKVVEH